MNKLLASFAGASLIVSAPAFAVPQPAPAAQAPDPTKLAEAHAIIEIMFPPAEREHTMNVLLDQLSAQYRKTMPANLASDPGLRSILEKFLDKANTQTKPMIARRMPQLFDAMAGAYTRKFSLVELKDIHAFALTPSGGHYLSSSLTLMSDPAVAKVNGDLIADAQRLVGTMASGLAEDIEAYLKAHPDVVEKLAAQSKAK